MTMPVSASAPATTLPRSLGASHYIFAAVLLLRLVALTRLSASASTLQSSGDMQFYAEWARRISHGQLTDHLAFYGLPLYAYFLAGLSLILGASPFVPAFFQTICDAGTATLLYKISGRVFAENSQATPLAPGQVIGIIAAAGWALFLPAQAYAIILMPTAIAVFVFWFLVWQVVKRDQIARATEWLLYGLLVGFAATAVAAVLFALPLLAAAVFFKKSAGATRVALWKTRLFAIASLTLGVCAGTAPCWIHNAFVARDPVFLSAHSGVNFWIGNNPAASGYPHFPGLRAGQAEMLEDSISIAESAAGHPLKRSAVSAYWSAKTRQAIFEDPARAARLIGLKFANFWNAFEYDDLGVITELTHRGVLSPGLRFGLVAALAFPGLLLALPAFPRARWIAAAVLLHMLSVLPVFVTERYRLAAGPGLMVFGAFGLVRFSEALATMNLRPASVYLCVALAGALVVSLPRTDPSLWAFSAYSYGRQALAAGDLAAAAQQLERAHAYAPENAETNFALGNLRLAQGDHAAAHSYYSKTLAMNPRHKGALSNLGVLALDGGNPTEARSYFSAALQFAPADPKAHFLLAKSAFALRDYEIAEAEVARAISLSPSQPEFLALRDEIRKAAAKRPNGE